MLLAHKSYESEGGKLTKVEPPQAGYVGEEVEGLISTDGVRGPRSRRVLFNKCHTPYCRASAAY